MQRTLSPSKRGFVWEMKHNRTLYLMCVPALLLLLAFAYLPMGGIYMAFTKFNVKDGIFGSPLSVSRTSPTSSAGIPISGTRSRIR